LLFTSFIGIVLITGWLYFTYKPKVTTPIPSYADTIFCMDVTNLRNKLLKEYLSGQKFDSNSFFDLRKIGLKVPSYVIGFTCLQESPATIFTSFEIKNLTQTLAWFDSLENMSKYTKEESENLTHYTNPSKTVRFSIDDNNSRLLCSVGLATKNHQRVYNSVFNKKNIFPTSHPRLKEIRQSEEIGFIWLKQGERIEQESKLILSFNDSNVSLNGSLFLRKEYQFQDTNKIIIPMKESKAYLSFYGGKSKLINEIAKQVNRKSFEKVTNMNFDSILYYSDNSVSFHYYDSEIKTDSVITYEYDEDFNKIEKLMLDSTLHPIFDLLITEKNKGLFSYFENDSIIKSVNGKDVFTPYPFSTVYATKRNGVLLATADSTNYLETTFPSVFEIHVNCPKIAPEILQKVGINDSFFSKTAFNLNAFQRGDSTKIVGNIHFN